MKQMVYVRNMDGKPLMPCSPAIARLLLKQGKVKVKHRTPFTIQLLYKTDTEHTQPVTLGVDTGSSKVGSAAVDHKGNVIYLSQIEIRNDISEKMKQRAKYRRNRRNRKTRYREKRFVDLLPMPKGRGFLRETDLGQLYSQRVCQKLPSHSLNIRSMVAFTECALKPLSLAMGI
jgi:hypothetical protein